jgi:hypothetical protein
MGPKDVPDSPPFRENQPLPETSAVDLARGAPGALLAAGSSIPAGIAGRVVGLANAEAGPKVAQALTYEPSERGKATLDAFGKLMDKTKLAGLGPMFATEMAATPAGPAGRRAASGAAETVRKAPGKLADVVTPTPAPEIARLAKKAEDMGIQLRPDMLANNRIAKFIGEALEQVPLSGSKAEQRQIAFNGALAKIVGAEGKVQRLTPDVFDRAMTTAGEGIGRISKETPVTFTPELRAQFNNIVQEAAKFETNDVARIISNYVQEMDSLTTNGVMPGEAFRKLNSKIGSQVRSTGNGDLKNALYKLQESMHDALEANIASPEKLAELRDYRYKYAMGKIIEPLVAKAKGGDISPQALMGAVTSDSGKKSMMARGKGGEIGDLARIGQAFLKEPPSSGTGERLGAYSLLTGGVVAEPTTAASIVGAANLYNRLGPALTKRAINRRAIDPAEAQPWSDTGTVNKLTQ